MACQPDVGIRFCDVVSKGSKVMCLWHCCCLSLSLLVLHGGLLFWNHPASLQILDILILTDLRKSMAIALHNVWSIGCIGWFHIKGIDVFCVVPLGSWQPNFKVLEKFDYIFILVVIEWLDMRSSGTQIRLKETWTCTLGDLLLHQSSWSTPLGMRCMGRQK